MTQEKKTETALKEVPQQVFMIMDLFDEKAVTTEILGRVTKKWVYHFSSKESGEVWGLAKEGVDEAVNRLAAKGWVLREDDLKVEELPDDKFHARFTAKVSLVAKNKDGTEYLLNTVFGTKRQPKYMSLRDGRQVSDKFWYEKGSAKALRNARTRLIPEEIKASIIAQAKKAKDRIEEIKAEDVGEVENAAPAETTMPHPTDVNDTPPHNSEPVKEGKFGNCEGCGVILTKKVAEYSKKKHGRALCFNCQRA